MKKEKNGTSRRDFLKTALTATAVGAACFSFGDLRIALAAARKADKPLLSAENINALVPDEPNETYFKIGKEAARDPRAFLKKYFYIDPQQEKGLSSFTEDDWQKVRKGIQTAINKKYDFVVTVTGERGENRLSGGATIVSARFAMAKWSVEVGAEGGAGSDGKFEGKVSAKVKKEF